jgi:hypothetical protein
MADRDAWQNLTRFSIVVLIVIVIALIVYTVAGGPKIPEPQAPRDTVAAPGVKP